jgi:hypothetical protein
MIDCMCNVALLVPCCALVGVCSPSGVMMNWHSCESSCRGSFQYPCEIQCSEVLQPSQRRQLILHVRHWPGDLFGLRVGVATVEGEAELLRSSFGRIKDGLVHLEAMFFLIKPRRSISAILADRNCACGGAYFRAGMRLGFASGFSSMTRGRTLAGVS